MRTLRLWLPVVLWCALIAGLSAVPNLSSGLAYDFPLRKLGHMTVYGVLWWLARRAFAGSGARRPGVLALVFAACYAATDEWHQSFVRGRHGSPVDVAIDSAGAALAAALTRRPGFRPRPSSPR